MARSQRPQPRLLIYTGDNCPYCRQLKQYLQRQGIGYRERNIQRSKSAAAEYRRLGLRGVPVSLIGQRQIAGFQPERIGQALAGTTKHQPTKYKP
ncbi:MAG: glutaredoxin family protein [Gammaproteobacteria bacterium SHHR-1]